VESTTTTTPVPRSPGRGTFYFLQNTILVAIIVATLFTAWTDPGLLPGSFSQRVAAIDIPLATQTAEAQFTPTPRGQPLVGIVVGHWDDSTKDPGAVCADIDLTEFQVNQNVATRVQALLEAQNVDVELLREFDPRLPGYQASALVSIHADSCDYINDQATGFKVAAAMANPRPQLSARLTACLRQRYAAATGLTPHSSITADMSSYHAFDEISKDTTAAIIEVGFLNLDRDILTQGVDRIAQGVADGILCYINNEGIPFAGTPEATAIPVDAAETPPVGEDSGVRATP
jgi:N-acetylmuramoyl-L-alanine amidase